jgi:hypothetical protein
MKFLSSQTRNTLQYLQLEGSPSKGRQFDVSNLFNLASVTRSTNISIDDSSNHVLEASFDSNSTKLRLSASIFHSFIENWNLWQPISGVTELRAGILNSDLLNKISHIFPTLKRLTVSSRTFMEKEQLEIIFSRMKNLEDLRLGSIFPGCIDSCLIGVPDPAQVLKDFNKWKGANKKSLVGKDMSTAELVDKFMKDSGLEWRPSLRNLTSKSTFLLVDPGISEFFVGIQSRA